MSYRLAIYGSTGTGTPVTTLSNGDFTLKGWSRDGNGCRAMTFSLHKFSTKATADYLRKERVIVHAQHQRGGKVGVILIAVFGRWGFDDRRGRLRPNPRGLSYKFKFMHYFR